MDNITSKATEHGDYTYTYDALHRLVDVDNPEAAGLSDEVFTYDFVGNRLTDVDSTSDWGYNDNNELQSSFSSNGNAVYEYDANGNTIKKTVGSVVTSYVYSVEDRLTEVWSGNVGSGSLIASYYYDPFGRRLSKTLYNPDGTVQQIIYYHYSDEGLVAEMDSTGNVDKSYGWKPGSMWGTDPLFMKEGGAYFFYHNDHLGTPQKLTSSNGAVVWSAKYSSFGEATVEIDTVENNLRFPGQYYDSESGLHYNYHRYYDPEVGRYLRVDPIGFDGGDVNLFSYSAANPLQHIDNLGLSSSADCSSGEWDMDVGIGVSAMLFAGFQRSTVTFTCLSCPFTECTGLLMCSVFGVIGGGGFDHSIDFTDEYIGTGRTISGYYSYHSIENYTYSKWLVGAGKKGSTTGGNISWGPEVVVGVGKMFCQAINIVCHDD